MPVPPIAYYDFNAGLGDAMGGPSAEFYERDGRAKTAAAATPAPATGVEGGALAFDGDGQFAYIPHSQALEVQNGTIALWVNPDSLDDERVFVSKDERDTDEGGHFYVGLNDGRLQVRVAPGDGGGNVAWRSLEEVFEPGQWTHVAVSFGADGVHLYINGARLEASALERIEGRIDDPAEYLEAHLLTNDKPLVLGGATRATKDTSSPEAIAQTGPTWMYDGDIDGFGIWGGTRPEDALSASQIAQLAAGAAAPTTPLPPTPVDRTDDDLTGGDGADALDGGFGDDVLRGGAGIDDLKGGYDDDRLYGGDDDDVLNGGRGSDFLDAGAGNDLIILGADGGEPIVAQVYDPAIDDPDDEVNDLWQTVNPGQPMIGDDIALGGDGADVFLIQPALNAKRDILLKHQNADRTIDWKRVAGENGEVHD
ncbi:MAG: LamG-like jellyroll fold domain-containing protein, partial [Pseudomonadota bacterium]